MLKPPPLENPVILTITLNTDGTLTILTQQGTLASLRAFHYRSLDDVQTCIMTAAAHLAEILRNPPTTIAETTVTDVQPMPEIPTAPSAPEAGDPPLDPQLTLF